MSAFADTERTWSRVMQRCSTILTMLAAFCIFLAPYTRTSAASQPSNYRLDLGVAQAAGIAIAEYADHHNGRLPKSSNWEESIKPYWLGEEHYTVSFRAHPGDRLAMNSKLSGVNLKNISPDSTVVLYETHSSVRDARGLPPWKQFHQCGSATKGWRMIVFASGWACSCTDGPDISFVHKK